MASTCPVGEGSSRKVKRKVFEVVKGNKKWVRIATAIREGLRWKNVVIIQAGSAGCEVDTEDVVAYANDFSYYVITAGGRVLWDMNLDMIKRTGRTVSELELTAEAQELLAKEGVIRLHPN